MAWISVHEDVVGPKLRKLARLAGCSRNEALGNLILIWLWGIKNADQSGLIKSADNEDVAGVISFGYSEGLDPVKFVDSMVEAGWIDERGGELYLHDWDEWQEMWYQHLQKKERDTARKREARLKEREAGGLPSPPPPLPPPPPPPAEGERDQQTLPEEGAPPPEEKKGGRNAYTTGFERFWEIYPRRVDKGSAYKKYSARRKDGFSDDDLIEAARKYAAQCQKKRTEPDYIKHAKTFLGDTLPFTDFLPKPMEPMEQELSEDGNPYSEWGDKHE